jgi:sugar fermentation stimulation protein A
LEWEGLARGTFVRKVNQFAAWVSISDNEYYTYVPNPTPAAELLSPGADVLLVPTPSKPKTKFRLLAAETGSLWATLDTSLPNVVFREGVRHSLFEDFAGRVVVKENVRLGRSVIDFLLSGTVLAYVEVKSCTLVRDGTALFPDAVPERGRRHLLELEGALSRGAEAVMVWIVQRPDAIELRPYPKKDPKFSEELSRAKEIGVRILAYRYSFDTKALRLVGRISVTVG